MSRLPEIKYLFSRLATSLQTLDPTARNEDKNHDLLISNLNKSLNLGEPRVRVLDTTLSLMCFTAPQVFDSFTEYLVKTIVTVLSSTINCKVLRIGRYEVLQIGSLISSYDCADIIEVCADVLVKLEGHGGSEEVIGDGFCNFEGTLSRLLLYAVVRVVASTSHYRRVLQLTPLIDVKSINTRGPTLSKLLRHLPKEISLKSQEVPLGLLFWYLDPLILKDDVSQILQEAIGRPFLCLNNELYERIEWRSVIICLVISPAMFIETRALLHNWFLATGLASVLEIQTELVSLVLDVISRPMRWGLSAELGSKLPFSHAYFPYNHQLLRTLAGPLSPEGFLHLLDSINMSFPLARRRFGPALNQAERKISLIDSKSIWSMVINFPDWFCYASVLLFSDIFHFKCAFGPVETDQSAAARYIAWVLNPINESLQGLLADSLKKISNSYLLEKFDPNKNSKVIFKKKLKKPKEDRQLDGCETIRIWLKDFQEMYIKYYNRIYEKPNTFNGFGIKRNVLFRRIPLGIVIGFCEHVDEEGCEVLLHYTATGTIFQSKCESTTWAINCNRKEAVEGACIVFNLTDVAERMADSIFDSEESGVDFICRIKLRVGKYLIKCLKKLLKLIIDQDDEFVMLRDLHNRLLRWKHQGKDVFMGNKDMDDANYAMRSMLSSL
ncbi:hypothetical protein LguiB_011853 [Lonicera macranthoides]